MHVESLERRRLLAAGDLDRTFGTNGALAVTEQLVGDADNPGVVHAQGTADEFFVAEISTLAKVDASGSPVSTFGTNGKASLPFEFVTQTLPLANGKIMV